jgi:hypothetical protein
MTHHDFIDFGKIWGCKGYLLSAIRGIGEPRSHDIPSTLEQGWNELIKWDGDKHQLGLDGSSALALIEKLFILPEHFVFKSMGDALHEKKIGFAVCHQHPDETALPYFREIAGKGVAGTENRS